MGEKTHMGSFVCAITLCFALLTGCAETIEISRRPPQMITPPPGTYAGDMQDVSGVLEQVYFRNKMVEDSQDWIGESYNGLNVRSLRSIPESQFAEYKKYLDDGSLYIIVHPAFFTFFHTSDVLGGDPNEEYSQLNVVERFLSLNPSTPRVAVLQAQERRMRDFLEFKSTQKKLIILVLPKNYKKYKGYVYRKQLDEYARYINEVTNGSESVLYVQSKSANRGYLRDGDMHRLMEFLINVDAEKVLVGGGYVGRCLEGFYTEMVEDFGYDGIFVVPELADISPRELKASFAKKLLMPDGSLNVRVATDNLQRDAYEIQRVPPRLLNLQ